MVIRSHLRVVPDPPFQSEQAVTIDCDVCVAQHTAACHDCVVSYVVGREIGQPVEFAESDARAIALLAEAGLVPTSKFQRAHPVA